MRARLVFVVAALAIILGVGWAFLKGTGPLPDQKAAARTAGRTVFLSLDQAENATLISAIGVQRGLPARQCRSPWQLPIGKQESAISITATGTPWASSSSDRPKAGAPAP
ncbi:MAG: hypothetical protein R2709_05195 [Marmoricola sp.]